jgi:hypothetical protein
MQGLEPFELEKECKPRHDQRHNTTRHTRDQQKHVRPHAWGKVIIVAEGYPLGESGRGEEGGGPLGVSYLETVGRRLGRPLIHPGSGYVGRVVCCALRVARVCGACGGACEWKRLQRGGAVPALERHVVHRDLSHRAQFLYDGGADGCGVGQKK